MRFTNLSSKVKKSASISIAVASVAALSLFPGSAFAQTANIGVEGPSYSGAASSPTASKPESKLWYNNAIWWSAMFDTVSKDYHIFRLNPTTQAWTDTGTLIDGRTNVKSDVLLDSATRVFVATHVYSETPATGSASNLYRYTYNATTKAHTLDAGFPTQINNTSSESLVIARNTGTSGKMWATWVEGGKVMVNSANKDGTGWGTPFALPVTNANNLTADDISSIVAFNGNKYMVMWSNQTSGVDGYFYSLHTDGTADTTWTATKGAYVGNDFADDHISLKFSAEGHIYAAVKTSNSTATQPLVVLLDYTISSDTWRPYTVSTVADLQTRPVVVVNDASDRVYVASTDELSGAAYLKSSPDTTITFPAGKGTVIMQDGTGGTEHFINDVTSAKLPVTPTSDLLLQASNNRTLRYWHALQAI